MLGRLGVVRGDTALVHRSFDAFEGFQGKPTDVIAVLQGVVGAIAGSFSLFGEDMRAGYPNWATKYLLDALLLQHRLAHLTRK